ncbi:MAG: glycosyltransferase family 4 protein [Ferruginibacter sp.]
MKILHLLYSGLGGTGNVFFSMIKADENSLFEYEAIFAGVEDIRQEYIMKSNLFGFSWKYIRKKRGWDTRFSRSMVSSITTSPSSIILLHGSRFILLAKIAAIFSKNKKKILAIETQSNHLKTKKEWVWLILTLLLADHIVFLTEQFKHEVGRKFPLLYRTQNCSVINNGIDLALFTPAIRPRTEVILLGMQSRIVTIKDHATLLKAFALLQTAHPELTLELMIAGEGDNLPAMKELAEELKISAQVQFTGLLDEPQLVGFLQSLDIYIHASLGETMSTAIMQAMACKLPVIASDVPGISNMITNKVTGILVPVQNTKALAHAIYSLITDAQKAGLIKEAAFNFAQSYYSNTTMFAKYKAVFEQLKT